jgi:hypothetical protein
MVSPEAVLEIPLSKDNIKRAIDFYCTFYDVPCDEMRHIVSNESGYNQYAHNNNPKTRDDSWGLVQVNKFNGGHPDISIAEAESPFFALNYLASELKKGHCSQWSTCDLNDS